MTINEVAVVRALQVGDLLCATPALRSMRAAFPEARVTLIGLPWAADIARRLPSVHDFVEFPGWHGIAERGFDEQRFEMFERALPVERFDLAVQLQGNGRHINGFLARIPARSYAAFVPDDVRDATDWPAPAELVPYTEGLPEPLRLLALTERIGAPFLGNEFDFPIETADRHEAKRLREEAGLVPGSYVCLHPGSVSGGRWPAERFADLARRLLATGRAVVVTGTEAESPLAKEIRAATGDRAIDVTGRTSLGGLAALLEGASLLVANDTSVSHIAAALRVPSIIIFTTSDRERWAPLDRTLHVALGGNGDPMPTPGDVMAFATAQLRRVA